MGELLAVALSRGKCHWQKIRTQLASRLTASTSGCSSLTARRHGTRSRFILPPGSCTGSTGSSVDTHMGHHGLPGLDDTTILRQNFLFAMALQTALTWSNMARTNSKWDNGDYILLSLLFFFSYQCVNEQKENPISLWYRDIPLFSSSAFCVSMIYWFIGMM